MIIMWRNMPKVPPTMGCGSLEKAHSRAHEQMLAIQEAIDFGGEVQSQTKLDGHLQKIPPRTPFSKDNLTMLLVRLIAACDLVRLTIS